MLKRFSINKKNYVRKVLFVFSDSHCGFRLGLLKPKTQLYDATVGENYYLIQNETQKVIWELLETGIEKTKEFADGDDIVGFFLGDARHGNHYIDSDHDIIDLDDQAKIAIQGFEPVAEMCTAFQLTEGTKAHGNGESKIAEALQEKFPDKKIKSVYHGRPMVGGAIIEHFHKGPNPGGSEHTRGNIARSFLRNRMNMDLKKGNQPADLYLCGHFHSYVCVHHEEEYWGQTYKSQLIVSPPTCSLGKWGRDAMRNLPFVEVGCFAVEIIDGEITQKIKFAKVFELRVEEELC